MTKYDRVTAYLKTLSSERFDRYLKMAGGDTGCALELYSANAQLSQALYIPLQGLEITLRNSLHSCLSEKFGSYWFDRPEIIVLPVQVEQIGKAKADVLKGCKAITPGQIVANLPLGFWTSFFKRGYDELWRHSLKDMVIEKDGVNRKSFSGPLETIREIRNRIAHHECILHPDLKLHHEQIGMIAGRLSAEARYWIKTNSTFEDVYQKHEKLLKDCQLWRSKK